MSTLKRRKKTRVKNVQAKGMRMCCACREKSPRDMLLRFVLDAQGKAWLDPYLKAPGRGAHLCYQKSCIERAVKKRSLSVSFKSPVILPDEGELMRQLIEAQLSKIRNLIGLARRQGRTISGLNMLQGAKEEVLLLVLASDIAETTKKKLTQDFAMQDLSFFAQAPFVLKEDLLRAPLENSLLSWIDSSILVWDGATLGKLIGKAHRVAIGITQLEIAQQIKLEIRRISQVLVATSP